LTEKPVYRTVSSPIVGGWRQAVGSVPTQATGWSFAVDATLDSAEAINRWASKR
jgi:hypothetical protein